MDVTPNYIELFKMHFMANLPEANWTAELENIARIFQNHIDALPIFEQQLLALNLNERLRSSLLATAHNVAGLVRRTNKEALNALHARPVDSSQEPPPKKPCTRQEEQELCLLPVFFTAELFKEALEVFKQKDVGLILAKCAQLSYSLAECEYDAEAALITYEDVIGLLDLLWHADLKLVEAASELIGLLSSLPNGSKLLCQKDLLHVILAHLQQNLDWQLKKSAPQLALHLDQAALMRLSNSLFHLSYCLHNCLVDCPELSFSVVRTIANLFLDMLKADLPIEELAARALGWLLRYYPQVKEIHLPSLQMLMPLLKSDNQELQLAALNSITSIIWCEGVREEIIENNYVGSIKLLLDHPNLQIASQASTCLARWIYGNPATFNEFNLKEHDIIHFLQSPHKALVMGVLASLNSYLQNGGDELSNLIIEAIMELFNRADDEIVAEVFSCCAAFTSLDQGHELLESRIEALQPQFLDNCASERIALAASLCYIAIAFKTSPKVHFNLIMRLLDSPHESVVVQTLEYVHAFDDLDAEHFLLLWNKLLPFFYAYRPKITQLAINILVDKYKLPHMLSVAWPQATEALNGLLLLLGRDRALDEQIALGLIALCLYDFNGKLNAKYLIEHAAFESLLKEHSRTLSASTAGLLLGTLLHVHKCKLPECAINAFDCDMLLNTLAAIGDVGGQIRLLAYFMQDVNPEWMPHSQEVIQLLLVWIHSTCDVYTAEGRLALDLLRQILGFKELARDEHLKIAAADALEAFMQRSHMANQASSDSLQAAFLCLLEIKSYLNIGQAAERVSFASKPTLGLSMHAKYYKGEEKGKCTDIQLKVKEQTLWCHKVVLAQRSECFEGMFTSNLAKDRVVEMEDTEFSTLKSVVQFCYTGACSFEDDAEALKVFALANKLLISDLEHACLQFLCKHISETSVSSILAWEDCLPADLLQSIKKWLMKRYCYLPEECQAYVKNNWLSFFHILINKQQT